MTSLSLPSTLCSFPIPSSLASSSTPSSSSGASSGGTGYASTVTAGPVHTPRAPGQAGEEGEVVCAVQGGAVWVYDIGTHRATTSFTVPPSTRFASPPLSFYVAPAESSASNIPSANASAGPSTASTPRPSGRVRRTVVAIQEGEDVPRSERGKWLWIWDGDDVYEKRAVRLEHQVDQLALVPGTQSFLAAGGSHVSLLTSSLTAHTAVLPAQNKGQSSAVVRISFAQRSGTGHDSAASVLRADGNVASLRVQAAGEREGLQVLGSGRVRLEENEEARDGWVDKDGWMGVYTSTVRMIPRAVHCFGSSSASALEVNDSPEDYRLRTAEGVPPIASIPTATGPLILGIAPSATSASAPHLLILQPALPAVIASLPLPAVHAAQEHTQLVPLGVTASSGGGAFALVSVLRSTGSGAPGKAVISLLEARVPPHGVGIAGMLGSAERTAAFVLGKESPIAAQGEGEDLVRGIEEVLAGRTLGENDEARVNALWEGASKDVKTGLAPREVRRLVRAVLSPAVGPVSEDEGDVAAIAVRGVKGVYARTVLRDLLSRGVVSDAMALHGGALANLIRLGDWETIDLAMAKIPNLPSASLLAALLAVLKPSSAGMSAPPTLEAFIARYITVPVAGPTHRAELHRSLDGAAVASVLNILVDWLEEWRLSSADGLIVWKEDKGPSQRQSPAAKLPPLQAIITHATLLLDSHLPLLVAQPRHHDLVTRLSAALDPLMQNQRELQIAHGIVHAFVSQAEQEKQQQKELRARGKGKSRGVQDQGVGLYRREEIVL